MRNDNFKLKEELKDADTREEQLYQEIWELERKIRTLEEKAIKENNMTVEQFDNIELKAGMKVIYRRSEHCKLVEDKEDENNKNLYLIQVGGIWQKTTKQMYEHTILPKQMIKEMQNDNI